MGEPKKAVSVQQPWADRILFEGKDIENRTWRLPAKMKGERVYLHAGKRPRGRYNGDADRLGSILGEMTIIDCVEDSPSPWFEGPYGWVVADVLAYSLPIPCKGALGFFDPNLASPIPAQVEGQDG